MGVGQHLRHGVDRTRGDARGEQAVGQFLAFPLGKKRREDFRERLPVLASQPVGFEPWVFGEPGAAEDLGRLAELTVIGDAKEYGPGLGLKLVIRRHIGVRVARKPGQLAVHEPTGGVGVENADARIKERQVDELPAPRPGAFHQGHGDPDGGVEPDDHVDDRDADPRRPGFGGAGDAVEARHRLRHGVIPGLGAQGTIGAEAGYPAMDEPWETAFQDILVSHAPPFQGADLEILDQHVGRLEQPEYDLAPRRRAKVQRDAQFVAVDAFIVRTGDRAPV